MHMDMGILIAAKDYVGADGGSIIAREFLRERNHSLRLQVSPQRYLEPSFIGECAAAPQIWQHTSAHGDIAVASGTISLKKLLTFANRCRTRWIWQRC